MKKLIIMITLLIASISFDSCGQSGVKNASVGKTSTPSRGNVYLRTVMWSGSLDISWVYLGSNGVIVMDPKHGVDPLDLIAEKADNSSKTGTYKITGNKMSIQWANGKSSELSIEFNGKEISAIDGGLVSKQPALPANFKIAGKYAARASTANLSASQTMVFSKDGTFSQSNFGGVSSGEAIASSQSSNSGTYNITGNTLTLNFADGKKTKSVITLMDFGGTKRLVIDSGNYPQEG